MSTTSIIIIQIFCSIFVILTIHYFYNFIKDTYSTKKTKDVVGFQVQKYQEIIQELQNNQTTNGFIPQVDQELMNSELLELVKSD